MTISFRWFYNRQQLFFFVLGVAAGDEGLMDVDAQCNEVLACLPKDGTLKGVLILAPVDFDKVWLLEAEVEQICFLLLKRILFVLCFLSLLSTNQRR